MSSNGTFVNKKKIPKNTPYRLYDEDIVNLSKGSNNFDSENNLPLSTLGKGAFAEVKLAVNRMTGEECARKVFSGESNIAKGGELFDRIIEQGHFTEDETRIVILQLLLGLNYLHKQGIVHRDIKPENILLNNYNGLEVKLADFGLAKIVGEQSFMKTLCGTPMYVAPEVLKSRSGRKYGNKVDMWSLGVVLYICVFGFPPFSGI
ncbi:putative myosin light chain kinase [Smittium mucronatum]|uniref:Putative myosin light chain kinase n=1 Tax=Smittium mucronatum TaxID=133383 RepID=A0A1R0H776_9FUNG|nr:putative myosin light chain kinase [Smittium mucronatum]